MENSFFEKLKHAYRMWNETKGQSSDLWLELFADDAQVQSMGDGDPTLAFADQCSCKEDVVRYFSMLLQDWDMIVWTAETFVVQGDKIAMFGICSWTNKRTGKQLDTRIAHLWEISEDKAVKLTEIYDSARVIAAAKS